MRGRWLVFGAATLWGTSATLARFVFHERSVPPLLVVELRLAFAVALLAGWLLLTNRAAFRIALADVPYFLVLGLGGVAMVQGSYYYSISRIGVGLAILIQYLAPSLIVAVNLLRGRPASRATMLAVVIAAAGTALLVGTVTPEAATATPFDWMVTSASAVFFAFYIVYSKRGLARYAPETVLLYSFTIAGIFWACVNPPWEIAAARYDAGLWMMFLLLGIFSTLVPFALFNHGLRSMPAAEAGVVATLEPVVAVVSAWVFLGEGLQAFQWIGALMVLAAAALASQRARWSGENL